MSANVVELDPAKLTIPERAVSAIATGETIFEYLHGLRHDVYFGRDYREGTQAFLDKRTPNF